MGEVRVGGEVVDGRSDHQPGGRTAEVAAADRDVEGQLDVPVECAYRGAEAGPARPSRASAQGGEQVAGQPHHGGIDGGDHIVGLQHPVRGNPRQHGEHLRAAAGDLHAPSRRLQPGRGGDLPGLVEDVLLGVEVGVGSHVWNVPLDGATLDSAARIGHYFLNHALAAFAQMGADPVTDDAAHVLDWIVRTGTARFTKRELSNAMNRGRFGKFGDLDTALHVLDSHGHIRRELEH